MKWQKKTIPVEQLTEFISTLKMMLKSGDERLENMRCIYTTEESNITYMLTVFDFMDLTPKPSIKSFSLGQMVVT